MMLLWWEKQGVNDQIRALERTLSCLYEVWVLCDGLNTAVIWVRSTSGLRFRCQNPLRVVRASLCCIIIVMNLFVSNTFFFFPQASEEERSQHVVPAFPPRIHLPTHLLFYMFLSWSDSSFVRRGVFYILRLYDFLPVHIKTDIYWRLVSGCVCLSGFLTRRAVVVGGDSLILYV